MNDKTAFARLGISFGYNIEEKSKGKAPWYIQELTQLNLEGKKKKRSKKLRIVNSIENENMRMRGKLAKP